MHPVLILVTAGCALCIAHKLRRDRPNQYTREAAPAGNAADDSVGSIVHDSILNSCPGTEQGPCAAVECHLLAWDIKLRSWLLRAVKIFHDTFHKRRGINCSNLGIFPHGHLQISLAEILSRIFQLEKTSCTPCPETWWCKITAAFQSWLHFTTWWE